MMASIPTTSSTIEKPNIVLGDTVLSGNGKRQYTVSENLGEGRCCVVYLISDTCRNEKFALKVFRPGCNYEGALQREQYILENLSSEGVNIVKYYEYFKYNDLHCMVQELLDCNIRQLIFKNGRKGFSFWGIQKFIKDVLSGLRVLHDEGFVHADLKPPNIMWSSRDGCYKLLDFGLSFHMTEENLHQVQSTGYQAPETKVWNKYKEELKLKKRLRKRKDDCPHHDFLADDSSGINTKLKLRKTEGSKCLATSELHLILESCQLCQDDKRLPPEQPSKAIDMWSLGCLFMEVVTGRKLLKGSEDDDLTDEKVQLLLEYKFEELLKEHGKTNVNCLQLVRNLIEKCLLVDSNKRLKCAEAQVHPFMKLILQPSINDLLHLPTPLLRMVNIIPKDCKEKEDVDELKKKLLEECSRHGVVLHCHMGICEPGRGNAYFQYYNSQSCIKALQCLTGQKINGHTIVATYFPLDLWAQNELF